MTLRWPTWGVAAGFALGATFHAVDFWNYGWWPYRFGPEPLNLFWNALLPIDLLVLALVTGRCAGAMSIASIVMLADVTINTYAWRVLGFETFARAVPFQAAFLIFTLSATWRGTKTS